MKMGASNGLGKGAERFRAQIEFVMSRRWKGFAGDRTILVGAVPER
jgi:hypothetical protein